MTDDRDLIAEQIAYYRARAAGYDRTSTPANGSFKAAGERVRVALRDLAPRGRVLELAAGTGQWTGLLADSADELVATDTSGEMLALNKAKVRSPAVEYRVVDALALEFRDQFDVVFFGFFLSHVPPGRFVSFWESLRRVLLPNGRVLFVDEADYGLWQEDWIDRDAGIVHRPLEDGRIYRAVKVLWQPVGLQERLSGLGWEAAVHAELPFYWGTARVPTLR